MIARAILARMIADVGQPLFIKTIYDTWTDRWGVLGLPDRGPKRAVKAYLAGGLVLLVLKDRRRAAHKHVTGYCTLMPRLVSIRGNVCPRIERSWPEVSKGLKWQQAMPIEHLFELHEPWPQRDIQRLAARQPQLAALELGPAGTDAVRAELLARDASPLPVCRRVGGACPVGVCYL